VLRPRSASELPPLRPLLLRLMLLRLRRPLLLRLMMLLRQTSRLS
jgi:hypothetical protein